MKNVIYFLLFIVASAQTNKAWSQNDIYDLQIDTVILDTSTNPSKLDIQLVIGGDFQTHRLEYETLNDERQTQIFKLHFKCNSYFNNITSFDTIIDVPNPSLHNIILYTIWDTSSTCTSPQAPIWTDTFIINSTDPTSINNTNLLKSKISIFPNPATSNIQLAYGQAINMLSMELLDLQGKRIKTIDRKSKNIDVSGLAKGLYLLYIKTEQGVLREKIVVE